MTLGKSCSIRVRDIDLKLFSSSLEILFETEKHSIRCCIGKNASTERKIS